MTGRSRRQHMPAVTAKPTIVNKQNTSTSSHRDCTTNLLMRVRIDLSSLSEFSRLITSWVMIVWNFLVFIGSVAQCPTAGISSRAGGESSGRRAALYRSTVKAQYKRITDERSSYPAISKKICFLHCPFYYPKYPYKIIRRLYKRIHHHANAPTIAINVAPKITAVKA